MHCLARLQGFADETHRVSALCVFGAMQSYTDWLDIADSHFGWVAGLGAFAIREYGMDCATEGGNYGETSFRSLTRIFGRAHGALYGHSACGTGDLAPGRDNSRKHPVSAILPHRAGAVGLRVRIEWCAIYAHPKQVQDRTSFS